MKQPYPVRRKVILTDESEADELVILDEDGNELVKSHPVHSDKDIVLRYEELEFISKPNTTICVTWDSVVKQVQQLKQN